MGGLRARPAEPQRRQQRDRADPVQAARLHRHLHPHHGAAIGVIAYAILEGTEGVGLAMRRRWAEYLTVIATGILIPYEAYEVIHRATLFKVGALLLNVAVVGYLAYRKRLFVGV
jgi:uncharacterized membrane protein (DUF2068 family)